MLPSVSMWCTSYPTRLVHVECELDSTCKKKKEGKGFPLQASSGSWGSRRLRLLDLLDFRHYEGGKVVTLTHWPLSPPGVFLVLIFRGWVDPRAHGSVGCFGKKSPATPLGIDPETFRLVAQCLNHYATPGCTCRKCKYLLHMDESSFFH
jgi:hypothetical protein